MTESQLSHINHNCGPILITGHTGFIGTWLTILLQRLAVEVIGLSLPAKPNSLFNRINGIPGIHEAYFDLRDEYKVANFISEVKPRVIIHLAAQSLVLESYKRPKYTFDVNVNGLANVLDIAWKMNSVEVILVSTTDKVYENSGLAKAFTEADPLKGHDPYSASKVAAENTIFAWRNLLEKDRSRKILTARSGNVVGGGDYSENRLLPDIVRAFSSETNLLVRNRTSTRPWQHVLDPLIGYLKMINNAMSGSELGILNFGPSEKSLTVQEVVDLSVKYWPSKSRISFTEDHNNFESKTLELDSSLARQVLNWKPVWSQEASIIETISWWRAVLEKSIKAKDRCNLEIEKALIGHGISKI